MPFKSKAQMRKLFSLEHQGKLKSGTAEEFAHSTPNISKLPEHVKKKLKKPRSLEGALAHVAGLRHT